MATSVLDGKTRDVEVAYAEGAEEGACIFEVGEGGRGCGAGSSARGRCGVKESLNGMRPGDIEREIVEVRR